MVRAKVKINGGFLRIREEWGRGVDYRRMDDLVLEATFDVGRGRKFLENLNFDD